MGPSLPVATADTAAGGWEPKVTAQAHPESGEEHILAGCPHVASGAREYVGASFLRR